MRRGVKTGGIVLAALIVLAPYTIVVSARAERLSDLGLIGAQQDECREGQGFIRAQAADGTFYAFGENGHVVKMERDPADPTGPPIVTFGTWDVNGELTMHPKTKHKVNESDGLCSDLFPAGA